MFTEAHQAAEPRRLYILLLMLARVCCSERLPTRQALRCKKTDLYGPCQRWLRENHNGKAQPDDAQPNNSSRPGAVCLADQWPGGHYDPQSERLRELLPLQQWHCLPAVLSGWSALQQCEKDVRLAGECPLQTVDDVMRFVWKGIRLGEVVWSGCRMVWYKFRVWIFIRF